MVARGNFILMTDADGATPIKELEKLEQIISQKISDSGEGVVIGSRVLSKAAEKVTIVRKIEISTFLAALVTATVRFRVPNTGNVSTAPRGKGHPMRVQTFHEKIRSTNFRQTSFTRLFLRY